MTVTCAIWIGFFACADCPSSVAVFTTIISSKSPPRFVHQTRPTSRRLVMSLGVRGPSRPWFLSLIAVGGCLLQARPVQAQIWIAPDRSIVNVGPSFPVQMRAQFNVTPVVVAGNRFVRVGGSYSAVIVNPTAGYAGSGFVQPQ